MAELTVYSIYGLAVETLAIAKDAGTIAQNPPASGDDLIIWPDDDYCDANELAEFTHKSDDYIRVPVDSAICSLIRESL